MNHLGKFAVYGVVILLLSLSFSQAVFAQEGETVPVGASVSGSLGAEMTEIVHPLELTAGELVTITVTSEFPPGSTSSSMFYEVKDADGNGARMIPPTYGVFSADGTLPYSVYVGGYNTSYTITLDAGDIRRTERGTATLDSHVTGQITGQQYDVYTLDAQEGDLITLRYTNTHFNTALYAGELIDEEGRDQRIVQLLSTADQMDVDPFYYANRIVYRIIGEPPYSLFVSTTQNEPDELVSYDIAIESGDTLERESLGALAAGQRLEGLLPDENGIYYTIQLDVEAGKTYTVEQWEDADVRFVIVDAALAKVPPNSPPATNSLTFEVADDNVLPLTLMVESAVYNTDDPFVFTLAEGEQPLVPADAELAIPADTTQAALEAVIETSEAPAAASCVISSNGESRQRVGPGTNYEVTGLMAPNANAEVIGQARGTDGMIWWQLAESVWIRSDLVSETGDCEAAPVVSAP